MKSPFIHLLSSFIHLFPLGCCCFSLKAPKSLSDGPFNLPSTSYVTWLRHCRTPDADAVSWTLRRRWNFRGPPGCVFQGRPIFRPIPIMVNIMVKCVHLTDSLSKWLGGGLLLGHHECSSIWRWQTLTYGCEINKHRHATYPSNRIVWNRAINLRKITCSHMNSVQNSLSSLHTGFLFFLGFSRDSQFIDCDNPLYH